MSGKKKNSRKKLTTQKLLLATALLQLIGAIISLIEKLIE